MSESLDKTLIVGQIIHTIDNNMMFYIGKDNDKFEVYCPIDKLIKTVDSLNIIDNKEYFYEKIMFIMQCQPMLSTKIEFQGKSFMVASTFTNINQIEPTMTIISTSSMEIIKVPLALLLCNRRF